MENQAFIELSIVIFTTLIICGLLKSLRQPIMVGYIISGLLLSSNFLNLIHPHQGLNTFSQIGISLLLFIVGIGLNPKHLKVIRGAALSIGLMQVIFCCIMFFCAAKILGFNNITSAYLAISLAFSSTIVIMKTLADRHSLESLPGQISISVLIIQDLLAMLILIVISTLNQGSNDVITTLSITIVKGAFLGSALWLAANKLIPLISRKIASSQEILLLFSLSWCMAIATTFHFLGFSMEIGALTAGICLSISPYRHEIMAKTKPLRDFFIMLFFVFLGSQIIFTDLQGVYTAMIVLSIATLIIKPLSVIIPMGILGYNKKTSFLAGVNFGQVSEFSLIIMALGVKTGHLAPSSLSLTTFITLISIAGSTYMMQLSEHIYKAIHPALNIFERKISQKTAHSQNKTTKYDIIIAGYSHLTNSLPQAIKALNKSLLIIDYNPAKIDTLKKAKLPYLYGDVSNKETLEEIRINEVQMLISAIEDTDINLNLIKNLRQQNSKCIIITASHSTDKALELYEAGADHVIMPFQLGSHQTASIISEFGFNSKKFSQSKKQAIKQLLIHKQMQE